MLYFHGNTYNVHTVAGNKITGSWDGMHNGSCATVGTPGRPIYSDCTVQLSVGPSQFLCA